MTSPKSKLRNYRFFCRVYLLQALQHLKTFFTKIFGSKGLFISKTLDFFRLLEGGEQTNGSADFENIFARISDSKRDFNGFPDPTCSGLRIHLFFGPGFWTLRVIQIFLPGFRIQGENGRAHLVGFAYPSSPASFYVTRHLAGGRESSYVGLNIPCLRINITLIFMSSSRDELTHKQENSRPDVSFGFRRPYLRPSKGHQHGVSIQSLINLVKRFSKYFANKLSHRPDSRRRFLYIYLLPFPRFWTFCIDQFAFLFLMV